MNRCFRPLSVAVVAGVVGAVAVPSVAHAQLLSQDAQDLSSTYAQNMHQRRMRAMSPKAERGWIEFLSNREAVVEGRRVRIGAGVRIRDQRNFGIALAKVVGLRVETFYVVNEQGLLQEVWLMHEDERGRFSPKERNEHALRMQGVTPSATQTNQRRRREDLRNVPFDQLPRATSNNM